MPSEPHAYSPLEESPQTPPGSIYSYSDTLYSYSDTIYSYNDAIYNDTI